jgi:hypothetical protein
VTNADVSLLLFTIAADGIALGAAASTSHTDVEMIVFLAIMLHKAPAAFGLVTFLLHEGLEKSRIKKHLLAFSLSAPVGTFLTYFCLGASFQDTLSDFNATGTCMHTCLLSHQMPTHTLLFPCSSPFSVYSLIQGLQCCSRPGHFCSLRQSTSCRN